MVRCFSSKNQTKEPKSITITSPLRYPGAKRQLVGYIKECLKINGLRPSLFIEPFTGGASVSLQLLQDDLVDRIGLNDLDPWVASFWETVFFDTDWLVEQIEKVPVTLSKWHEFKNSMPESRREQALTCIFLNRTSFSGILAPGAGPLGGQQQKSSYDIGCRFYRKTLIKRIRQAEALKDRVAFVWNWNWWEILKMLENCTEKVFYYFDPPFFEKAERLYRFYFKDNDHLELRDTVLNLDQPWILSYDSVQQVENLYGKSGKGSAKIDVIYSTSQRNKRFTQEAIISNLEKLPKVNKIIKLKNKEKNANPISTVSEANKNNAIAGLM